MLESKMIINGYEICHLQRGEWHDWHIASQETINRFVCNIREGKWCAILGPPRCQKSYFLDTLRNEIKRDGDKICFHLDLRDLSAIPDELFLKEFAKIFVKNLKEQLPSIAKKKYEDIKSETALQNFVQNFLICLQKDMVIFLDHLESINITPRHSLFKSLNAVYNQVSENCPYHLVVVTTNSSLVLEFDQDIASAFKRGHIETIQNLNDSAAQVLIDCIANYRKIEITPEARQLCIDQTAGDYNLTALLCESAADYLSRVQSDTLEKDMESAGIPTFSDVTERIMAEVINEFLDKEAKEFPFMQQTIQAVESDSNILLNVVEMLESSRLLLKPGLEIESNKLQCTGAFRIRDSDEGQYISIRNKIYHNFLKKHFHPERIVHVLRSEGKWDAAIRYLKRKVSSERNYRSLLLETIVHSIYAKQNSFDTYNQVIQALKPAFGIEKAEFFLENAEKRHLERVAKLGIPNNRPKIIAINGEQSSEPSEIMAYFGEEYFKDFQGVLHVSLSKENKKKLGLITIHDFTFNPQDYDSLRLLSFLKQVGRAIGHVLERKSRLDQLRTLNKMRAKLSSSLDLQEILHTTVDASLIAIHPAHSCELHLWDDSQAKLKLTVQKHKGSISRHSDGILEYYAVKSFNQKKPKIWGKIPTDSRASSVFDHARKVKSVVCVPLEAWGKIIGVIVLENSSINNAFQKADIGILSAFIAQAAISILNTRLHEELYNLGVLFNKLNISPEKIFEQTVNSILRVSDANASHMLLLNNTNDPEKCVRRSPELSKAAGVLSPLDGKIQPDHLTYAVLESTEPVEVTSPNEGSKIPAAAMKYGIKACLCLPMKIGKVIIGVLYVHYKNVHKFSRDEIRVLSLFANQSAAAIHNARLNMKRNEQNERLKVLQRISSQIVSRLNLDKILDTIAEDITVLLDAERSLFLLFDDKKLYYKRGYPDKNLKYLTHQEIMNGISGHVCRTGKPYKSRNASKDKRQTFDAKKRAKDKRSGPIVVAPIKSKGEFLGTLTAVNQNGKKTFSRKDLDLACMFANQSAVAIQNARYVQEIKEISKREKIAASIASHDFWTPLEIISSSVEVLRRKIRYPDKEEENIKEKFKIIDETIPFFACVASQGDFLDPKWSPSRKENLQLADLVNEVVRLFGTYAKYKGNKTFICDRNLKEIKSKYLDKQATKQVFFNLIVNAIKYSYPDSTIQINKGLPFNGFSDAVEISNIGEGIKEKEAINIFELGVRGKNKVIQPHGHGKGLFIARKIMRSQGGDVILISCADPVKFGVYFP